MKHMRRHKRYSLDKVEITGKMSLSDKVKVLDISLGGIAFKVDRRLSPGREYTLKLEDKSKSLTVTGIIVRSELCGIEARDGGESVTIYEVGMQFKNTSTGQLADFINSLAQIEKEGAPLSGERRADVRFQITAPLENTLTYPANFKVTIISLTGMLIETHQLLEINSKIPMGLTLIDGTIINLNGRVVSCSRKEFGDHLLCEIGMEFIDMTDNDKTLLQTFIGQWTAIESGALGDRETI